MSNQNYRSPIFGDQLLLFSLEGLSARAALLAAVLVYLGLSNVGVARAQSLELDEELNPDETQLSLASENDLQDFGFFDSTIPVVLSSSRLRHPLTESPAAITVIDRELIEQSGARSVVDLLHLVPGFQVGRIVNGNPFATYHGIAERYNPRMQLLIDGRPTYVPLYGGIPWGELPLNIVDIERIEVIRGPNAASFGPNSYYSVISVTTKAPEADAGWSIELEAGGNEYRRATLQHSGRVGRNPYRFSLQADRDEGFENIPDRERAAVATFSLDSQISEQRRLRFSTGIVEGGHMELNDIVEPHDLAQYEETDNAYIQLVWEDVRSVDDSWRVQYYYNYLDIKDHETVGFNLGAVLDNPDFNAVDFTVDLNRSTRSTRHEIELQKTLRYNSAQRFVFGGALRRDTVRGSYIFNDDKERSIETGRLFFQSDSALSDKLLLNTGLMLEENSLSGFTASPRLSLILQQNPSQHWRIGYSRAARTPLLLEKEGEVAFDYELSTGQTLTDFSIIDVDTDLKPEYIDVFEIGLLFVQPESDFSLDTKLSYQRMSDRIGTDTLSGFEPDGVDNSTKFYINDNTYSSKSVEFDLGYKPRRTTRFKMGYSYIFDLETKSYERLLAPRHTVSLFGSQAVGRGILVSAEYYYTSEWIWDDQRDRSKLNRLDLRLQKDWSLGGLEGNVAVQAELELGENTNYLERNEVDDMYFAKFNLTLP